MDSVSSQVTQTRARARAGREKGREWEFQAPFCAVKFYNDLGPGCHGNHLYELDRFFFSFLGGGGEERGPLFAEVCASAKPFLLLLLVLLFIIMGKARARLCEVRACVR